MGGYIKVDVEKLPVHALNMKINKDIFYEFKVKCKQRGYPLNLVIEVFMNQYGDGKYDLEKENIIKWKDHNGKTEMLNSTFNKEIYAKFKARVKENKFFVKHVIAAFVEDYVKNDLVLEFSRKE